MKRFTTQSMREIIEWIELRVDGLNAGETIEFLVQNPDDSDKEDRDTSYLYHSWRAWNDLATLMYCRMMTPDRVDSGEIVVTFQRLDLDDSFHKSYRGDHKEKYGEDSPFSLISKCEEPAFYYYYREALTNVKLYHRRRILDLGVNSGDEFSLIRDMVPQEIYKEMELIGVDYCSSAIKRARIDFPEPNVSLLCEDINQLHKLDLPKSDLIISIGTLQSPNIDFKPLFMSLIQSYLTADGAVILGFPNCRWIDREMIYGAKAPNYNFSEMSLVIKDIYFCKKYLQQHKFRVTITGKEYLFLTATKIKVIKKI